MGRAVDDPAVGGNRRAWANEDDVTDDEFVRCDTHGLPVDDLLGFIRQQRGETVQRRRGLRQRAHLHPVPGEHDHDQQRQLPPEVELRVEQTQRRTPRGDEGDCDRQCDEQHHARAAALDLVETAGQEGLAAPDVHDSAEDRREPAKRAEDARFGNLVSDEVAEHRAEGDDGYGDDEHDPEQSPELRDVIAVAGMSHVARMTSMPLVTGVPAMTAVVVMSGIGVIHGLGVCRMARFSRLHSVMLMILLFVHISNIYP